MSDSSTAVRTNDPDTSHEAAEKAAMGASKVRPVVLSLVREFGPITHDELIGQYHRLLIIEPNTPRASESGIRTRLSELRRAGLIEQDSEKGVSTYGNSAKRWVAIEPDSLEKTEPSDHV
jgi:hypothetical protein